MAINEEASPICRGKNLSWETVMLFFNNMPKEPMEKNAFHAYVEKNINGWTQTHSQIARQLAFYYEDNGICYPRFDHASTLADLFAYMVHWAHNYFIPNPYTPSLKGRVPTSIYNHIIECIKSGNHDFDSDLNTIFDITLSSHDKVKAYLQNYTNIKFDNGEVSINQNVVDNTDILTPSAHEATDAKAYYLYFGKEYYVSDIQLKNVKTNLPLQQIYYGAPGTGKSYEINEITKSHSAIRTTFHPDSDYSTFVGAYKPVMSQVDLRDVSGHVVIEDGKKLKEERITYKYVKQAFLKAYLAAWQKYSNGGECDAQFLIIEEINRGNCAQIFGDLFQLLDRADNGYSTYPIEADTDLQTEIRKAFGEDGEYALGEGFNIEGVVSGYDGITDAVKEGRVLLLPNNLYIWATMNTSDQSLFPIDSAFKRRWDWKYVKITDAKKGWKIKCGSEECDWWTFVTEINKKIAKETSSDDKKLGYFFCKPDKNGNTISEDKFVGKVLFYLWNDVFKDGDTSLFKVGEYTEEATFEAFYKDDNTVNIEAIRKFLVAVVGDNNIKSGNEEGPSLDGNSSNGIDYTKYSFNGETRLSKKDLGYKIVMKYINEHSDKTFEELQKDLAFDESVDNKYRYKGVLAKVEDINGSYQDCFGDEQTSSDSVNYKVLTWWNKYNIDFIINFAKKQGWSVEKETE